MIHGQKTAMRPVEPTDLTFLREMANDRVVATSVIGWDFPLSDHGQIGVVGISRPRWENRRFIIEDAAGRSVGMTGLWDIDWHNRSAATGIRNCTRTVLPIPALPRTRSRQ